VKLFKVRISTPAEVLAPWQAPTELSATLAGLYAPMKVGGEGRQNVRSNFELGPDGISEEKRVHSGNQNVIYRS